MVSAKGVKRAGFFDCGGGGQVVVENGIAYIGHIHAPARHQHRRCERPEEREATRLFRDAAGHAFAQGAGRQRDAW